MKKKISLIVCLVMCLSMLAGCGEIVEIDKGRNITLMEPISVSVKCSEKVQRRNLYQASVYEGAVYPYVEEYAFGKTYRFDAYSVYPGDAVKKGQILMHTTSEEMNAQIESLEARLQKLTDKFQDYCRGADEKLENLRETKEYAEWVLGNLDADPNYPNWDKEYFNWTGTYTKAELDMEMLEVERQEKTALHKLEYEYYEKQLNEVLAEREASVLRAEMDGQVVAIKQFYVNQRIKIGTPAVAVADMSRKYIKCQELLPGDIKTAYSVYAFINGKRYEVTYDEATSKNCSSFTLCEENNEVAIGDYAVLVYLKNGAENVLTVSNEALHQDVTKKYVHVLEGNKAVSKEVTTGISNGEFTEILTGLEEGDEVIVSESKLAGENVAVLVRSDCWRDYSYSGDMYYPDVSDVINPNLTVPTRLIEYVVKANQTVKKGDVVARVYTDGDPRLLEEKETLLRREKERLADLIAEKKDANEERIASWQESIAEMEAELEILRKEYALTEIVSESEGLIHLYGNDPDEELYKGGSIAEISGLKKGYVTAESRGFLGYGTKVEIMHTTMDDSLSITEGVVVSLGDYGVSEAFVTDGVLIQLPDGVLETVKQYTPMEKSGSYRVNKISVTAKGKYMANVVQVPVKAVTEKNGNCYVDVLLQDGTVKTVQFISGGKSRSGYWVVDGLDEGMSVCW